MKESKKTILFIFSGLPASGKSTLSKSIAREYKATYLRIDTIEQGLRDLCNINIDGKGYRLAYRIASDNLKQNLDVVADSCNPINLTRKEWEEIAKLNNCDFINIEVICSDKIEHKKRVELRTAENEKQKSPNWEEIENREYHSWENQRIVIDTAHKSIEESKNELKGEIEGIINRKNPAHNKSCEDNAG